MKQLILLTAVLMLGLSNASADESKKPNRCSMPASEPVQLVTSKGLTFCEDGQNQNGICASMKHETRVQDIILHAEIIGHGPNYPHPADEPVEEVCPVFRVHGENVEMMNVGGARFFLVLTIDKFKHKKHQQPEATTYEVRVEIVGRRGTIGEMITTVTDLRQILPTTLFGSEVKVGNRTYRPSYAISGDLRNGPTPLPADTNSSLSPAVWEVIKGHIEE